MPMNPNRRFAVLILTHGRPGRIDSLKTLERAGYTGEVYIIIDDEDATADEYRRLYGDKVIQFCKREVAQRIDQGDNASERRTILYARNAAFDIAEQLGLTHFCQWDDDYVRFTYRMSSAGFFIEQWVKSADQVFDAYLDFLDATPLATIAMAQNGDIIGGRNSTTIKKMWMKRKSMNTFFCRTDRRIEFQGRVNEDVNTYVQHGRRGHVFGTCFNVAIEQRATQTNSGGMTDAYLQQGTYRKSFYTVMYAPSCAKIAAMGKVAPRIHHHITAKYAYPKILRESVRKA
jgi:hypothetical protein